MHFATKTVVHGDPMSIVPRSPLNKKDADSVDVLARHPMNAIKTWSATCGCLRKELSERQREIGWERVA